MLRSARIQVIDRDTGEPYTQAGIVRELKKRLVSIEERTYGNIESGETKRPRPEVINALPEILPNLTVTAMVNAMGYGVEFLGFADEEEVALLTAYRRSEPNLRQAARAVLGLPGRWQAGTELPSLRRLSATDPQDRQGTPE